MAQPVKIQNEPSMDEILASIRRIIEDSEPMPAREPAKPVANDHVGQRPVTASQGAGPAAEKPAERKPAELKPAEPKPAEPVRLSPDLAHELDRVAASPAASRQAPQRERELVGESLGSGAARASLNAINAAAEGDVRQPRRADPPAPQRSAANVQEPRPQIMSDEAGRQVAAAFEELSAAYAQSRMRSFEEMAEEMLRPMLRDWLDNNLPGLVERLIREEIERIARGVPR